jgi:hypothetical protein
LGIKYRSPELESYREEIRQIAGKIVPNSLIGEKGDDTSGQDWQDLTLRRLCLDYLSNGVFEDLQHDRNGDEWGKPYHAELLISMCHAFGFLEFTHPWNPTDPVSVLLMKMGMPVIIRFFPIIREPQRVLN